MPSNGSRAFRGFIDLLHSKKNWLYDRVAAFDITPQMFEALHVLHESPDSSMREFSEKMFCDASNAFKCAIALSLYCPRGRMV